MKRILLLLLLASLAGCASEPAPGPEPTPSDDLPPPTAPSGGQGFAPQSGHDEDDRGDLRLVGDLRVTDCDVMFCIHAVASNVGNATYHVSDLCVTPWTESLWIDEGDAMGRVEKSEPEAHCEAFGTRPFAPGDSVEDEFSWDGRLWDASRGYHEAPEDQYVWRIAFRAYQEAGGGSSQVRYVELPVIIGET